MEQTDKNRTELNSKCGHSKTWTFCETLEIKWSINTGWGIADLPNVARPIFEIWSSPGNWQLSTWAGNQLRTAGTIIFFLKWVSEFWRRQKVSHRHHCVVSERLLIRLYLSVMIMTVCNDSIWLALNDLKYYLLEVDTNYLWLRRLKTGHDLENRTLQIFLLSYIV